MVQKFISQLSDAEKKFFYLTLVIVSLALYDRLFIGPVQERLSLVDEQIAMQKINIGRDLRILSYKDDILEEREVFSKYYASEIKEDAFLNADFLNSLERLANQTQVNLSKAVPSRVEKEKQYLLYYADVECLGSLTNMIKFVHLINSTDGLLKVSSYKMTPKRGSDDVSVSMTISKMVINPDVTFEITSASQ